jgi:hypothetical protein
MSFSFASIYGCPVETQGQGAYTCCLYYDSTHHYESTFCQLNPTVCPYVGGFYPVGNYTVSSCSACLPE